MFVLVHPENDIYVFFLNIPCSFIRSIPCKARDCAARAHEEYLPSDECVFYICIKETLENLTCASLKASRVYFCPFLNQWLLLKLLSRSNLRRWARNSYINLKICVLASWTVTAYSVAYMNVVSWETCNMNKVEIQSFPILSEL